MMENINELKTQSLPMSVDGIVEKIEQLSKNLYSELKT